MAHHIAAFTEVYPITVKVKGYACENHVSPAKYLAISELQQADPTATSEDCVDHTIGELRQLTVEHGGMHHGEDGEDTSGDSTTPGDANCEDGDAREDEGGNPSDETDKQGRRGGHHISQNTPPAAKAEYKKKHIKDATLIPDTEIAIRAVAELPDKSAVILVYCRSGRRSESAAKALVKLGYTGVYDFGGIVDWPYKTACK